MFSVREGVEDDCDAIAQLIKELALYERYPDGPKLDGHRLRADGFGARPLFYTLVAELNATKELIGYALFFYKYPTWDGKCVWMEDIYVRPNHRASGVGSALLKSVAQWAVREDCARFEFNVLDWNETAIQFYRNKGAVNLTASEGWNVFRFGPKQMLQLAQPVDTHR